MAAQLEAANKRIADMEASRAAEIRAEAERLVLEVMPEIQDQRTSVQGGVGAGFHPAERDGVSYRADQPDEELSPEQRLARQFDELTHRQAQLEDRLEQERIDRQLDELQARYPHMDRFRVTTFLAGLGEKANRVNIPKLAEISHNKELHRLEAHAQAYHAAEIAKIAGGPQAPNLPGPGIGAPHEGPKITRANASQVFAERLAARGWGKSA